MKDAGFDRYPLPKMLRIFDLPARGRLRLCAASNLSSRF